MESLLKTLYLYAQENRFCACLSDSQSQYRELIGRIESDRELLESGPTSKIFSRYLDHQTEADLIRDLALLQCGISMGLELARL